MRKKNGLLFAKSCPPPELKIAGSWMNVPEASSLYYDPGIHIHRAKRGFQLLGFGINKRPGTSNELVKVEISEDGWISYKFVNLETNFYKFLDTSVISWDNGEMETACCMKVNKEPMKYKYFKDGNEECSLIDGVLLKRQAIVTLSAKSPEVSPFSYTFDKGRNPLLRSLVALA